MEHDCHIYWEKNSDAIGDVIKTRREMLGLSRKELCEGICSERTLMRMELRQVKSQIPIVRELFDKLGLCAEYIRGRIITNNIEAIQLAERLVDYTNHYEMEKWENCLNLLEEKLDMEIVYNKQFIMRIRNLLEFCKQNISKEVFIEKLIECLEYTVPLKSVLNANKCYMTDEESICILNIATRLDISKENPYMTVLQNIANEYMKEDKIAVQVSMYELLMTEIASYLGNIGEYDKSDAISRKVLKECLQYGRLHLLTNNLYNNVWNYQKRVEKNLLIPQQYNEVMELKRCILLARIAKADNQIRFLEEVLSDLTLKF